MKSECPIERPCSANTSMERGKAAEFSRGTNSCSRKKIPAEQLRDANIPLVVLPSPRKKPTPMGGWTEAGERDSIRSCREEKGIAHCAKKRGAMLGRRGNISERPISCAGVGWEGVVAF